MPCPMNFGSTPTVAIQALFPMPTTNYGPELSQEWWQPVETPDLQWAGEWRGEPHGAINVQWHDGTAYMLLDSMGVPR